MSGFFGALSLLTRVPVPTAKVETEGSAAWFPVVGACVGVAVAAAYAVARELLPALPAAVIALSAGMTATGALHEDGLADTADALGSPHARSRAFEILKDPRVGTFGALALVAGVLLRAGALATLPVGAAWGVLVTAHSLGRAAPVGLMATIPAAAEGLGAHHADSVDRRGLAAALATGAVLAALGMGAWAFAAGALAVAGALWIGRPAARRLGGITGDILGACEQVVETAVLLLGAAIVHNDWPGLPF